MPVSPTRPVRWRRLVLALSICVVAVVVAVAITWRRLPDPVATHWTFDDRPDGTVPKTAAVAVFLAVPVAIAVLGLLVRRLRVTPYARRAMEALAVLYAGLISAGGVRVLLANAAGGNTVRLDPLTGLIPSALGLVLALLVAPGFPGEDTRLPGLDAGGGPDLLWRGSADSRSALAASLVVALFAGLSSFSSNLLALVSFALMSVILLSLTSVVVQIDRQALRVRYYGGLRWPAIRVPVASIRRCQVIELRPTLAGGPRGRMLGNGRTGPGLLLEIDDDSRVLIAVDDAERGCETLRALIGPGR